MVASSLTGSATRTAPRMSWMESNPLYWKDSTLISTISFRHSYKNHTSITIRSKTSVRSPQRGKQDEQQRDLSYKTASYLQPQPPSRLTTRLLSVIYWWLIQRFIFSIAPLCGDCCAPLLCCECAQRYVKMAVGGKGFPVEVFQLMVKRLRPQCSLLVGQCRIAVDNFVFRSVWPPQGLTNHFLPESPWLTHFLIANEVPLLRF